MIGILIGIVLYIVWPKSRPIIVALTLLTVLGMLLTLLGRPR